eukprot:11116340-Karenia_brevis.AAC.1
MISKGEVKALFDKSIDEWAKAITEVAKEIDLSNSKSDATNATICQKNHGARTAYMNWNPPNFDIARPPRARELPVVDIYEDPGIW